MKDDNSKLLDELVNSNSSNNILFEQYKLYVEMANDVSNRRENTNKFYLVLISAIIGLISALYSTYGFGNISLVCLLLIIIISISWIFHIFHYKYLNESKFEIINYIEKYLPANGFKIEWELLKSKKYKGLTTCEIWIPIILIIGCVVIILLHYWIYLNIFFNFF